MKIYLTEHRRGFCTVHMTQEIPWLTFCQLDFNSDANPYVSCFADKFMDFDTVTSKAVTANVGRNELEMTNPYDQIRSFLVDLTHIPGVESLVDQTRYSLSFEIALGFDPRQIALEVGDCVKRHFYPRVQITLEQVFVEPVEEKTGPPAPGSRR